MTFADDIGIIGEGYLWTTTDAVSAEGFNGLSLGVSKKLHGFIQFTHKEGQTSTMDGNGSHRGGKTTVSRKSTK